MPNYPRICRDGHIEIAHADSSSEMCPLCRAQAALVYIAEYADGRDLYGADAHDMAWAAKEAIKEIA